MKIETNSDVEPDVRASQDSQAMMATPSLPEEIATQQTYSSTQLLVFVQSFIMICSCWFKYQNF